MIIFSVFYSVIGSRPNAGQSPNRSPGRREFFLPGVDDIFYSYYYPRILPAPDWKLTWAGSESRGFLFSADEGVYSYFRETIDMFSDNMVGQAEPDHSAAIRVWLCSVPARYRVPGSNLSYYLMRGRRVLLFFDVGRAFSRPKKSSETGA